MNKKAVSWEIRLFLMITAILSLCVPVSAAENVEKPAPVPSLYDRLGGADNIAVVVDEIIERRIGSPEPAGYSSGKGMVREYTDRYFFLDKIIPSGIFPI